MISSDPLRNIENQKKQIETMDKIYNISEETLFYKSNELEEDSLFVRKFCLRLLKNHKSYLNITLDNY